MRRLTLAAVALATACGSGAGPEDLVDVAPDPRNTGGVQFETPAFEVAQGSEVQDCYFMTMPDLAAGADYYVDRVRLGTNPGSHHMNVFRVKTIVGLGRPEDGDVVHSGECMRSSNWADWPLVANNQGATATDGVYDWKLPDGVAFRFSPGERIMIQTHYVNASTQVTPARGKAVLDLYRSHLASPVEMGTLFATQQGIRVCRSTPAPVYTGACSFAHGGVTIAAANGHFHSRGERFEVFKWDGVTAATPPDSARFYRSTSWDDPPMSIYPPGDAMKVPEKGGIFWSCAYEWSPPAEEVGGCAALDAADKQQAGDCCYTFGPKVETSEHCNVFLYYYPRVDRADITCF